MRAYSEDLRRRVIEVSSSGEKVREVARRFSIAASTVVRWNQRYQETGSIKAKPMGAFRRLKLEQERDYIIGEIEKKPHISVRELLRMLKEKGVKVSRHAVWMFMRRAGLSYKKKPVCK